MFISTHRAVSRLVFVQKLISRRTVIKFIPSDKDVILETDSVCATRACPGPSGRASQKQDI